MGKENRNRRNHFKTNVYQQEFSAVNFDPTRQHKHRCGFLKLGWFHGGREKKFKEGERKRRLLFSDFEL